MNVGAKFDQFLANIRLTDAQVLDAQNKHEGVRTALKNYYYSSSYAGSTSILIGSYGKGTVCRPPTDVDILFKIPDSLYDKYNGFWYNEQSQLLQDVKAVLQRTYSRTDMRGDGQVVIVSFTGSFSVEVIPVYSSPYLANVYLTPDTHSGGSWKTANPNAERQNIITF